MTKEEYEALQKTSVVDKPELTTAAETKQPTLEDTATQQISDSINSHIPDSAQKQAAGISTAISAEDIDSTEAGKLDNNDLVKAGREKAAKIDPIDNKEKEKFYTTQTADDLRKATIDKAIQANDMSSIAMMYKGMDDATKAKWQDYVDAATKKNSALNNKAAQTADVANGDFTKETDYDGRDGTKTGDDMGQKTQNSLDKIHERDEGQTKSSTGSVLKDNTKKKEEVDSSGTKKKGIDWNELWSKFKGYMSEDTGGGGSRGYYALDALAKGIGNVGRSGVGGQMEDTAYNTNKAKMTGGSIENDLAASKISKTTAATTKANLDRMSQLSGVDLSDPGAFSELDDDEKADLKEGMKMFNTGSPLTLGDYGELFGGKIGKKLYDFFNK